MELTAEVSIEGGRWSDADEVLQVCIVLLRILVLRLTSQQRTPCHWSSSPPEQDLLLHSSNPMQNDRFKSRQQQKWVLLKAYD